MLRLAVGAYEVVIAKLDVMANDDKFAVLAEIALNVKLAVGAYDAVIALLAVIAYDAVLA